MNYLGELRERREEKGLTVEGVYSKLPVPSGFIEALEAGVVDQLPTACYAVGFLKSYCRLLEVDSAGPIRDLKRLMNASDEEIDGKRQNRIGDFIASIPRPRFEVSSWIGVSLLLLLGWLTWAIIVDPAPEQNQSEVRAAIVEPSEIVQP